LLLVSTFVFIICTLQRSIEELKAAAAATRKTKDWVNSGTGSSCGSEFSNALGENMGFDWHV